MKGRIYPFILVIFVLLLGWQKNFTFDLPYSFDHLTHFYRAWFYRYELLPSFNLWGWDNYIDLGYPHGYVYPFFGDLLVAGTHLLFRDIFRLEEVYGFYLAVTYSLMVSGVYRLGKASFSPLVGCLAGLGYVLEFGNFLLGGWNMVFYNGVWPCFLAVSLYLHGLVFYIDRQKIKKTCSVWPVALIWGFAGFTHSISSVVVLLTLFVIFFINLCSRDKAQIYLSFKQCGLIGSIYLLIAAPYLVNYIFSLDYLKYYTTDFTKFPSSLWQVFWQVSAKLTHLKFLEFFACFAILYSLLVVRKKSFLVVIIFLSLFQLVDLELWKTFLPDAIVGNVRLLQTSRFLVVIRPLYYVLVAIGIVSLGNMFWKVIFHRIPYFKPALTATGLLLSLFIVIFGHINLKYIFRSHQQISYRNVAPHLDDISKISALINSSQNSHRFYRVFIDFKYRGIFRRLPVLFRSQLKMPILYSHDRVALHFYNYVDSYSIENIRNHNIRYIVSDYQLTRSDLSLVAVHGKLRLYETKEWDRNLVVLPTKKENLHLFNFTRDSLGFEIFQEDARQKFILSLTYFPGLKVFFNEQKIFTSKLSNQSLLPPNLFELPNKKGVYRIIYENTWIQKLSLCLFLLGVLMVVGMFYGNRKLGSKNY